MARRYVRLAASFLLVALVFGGCRGEDGSPAAGGGAAAVEPEEPPTTPPPSDVAALVDGVLSPEGKRVFYEADPQLVDKAQFDAACPTDSELTVVLGCFYRGRISILRVDRPELAQVMAVTAVHEMLHAAYFDLPSRERDRVDGWVADFYAGLNDPDIRELVSQYDRDDPEQRPNELHSILPTEVAALSPPLENYYQQYFLDRPRVVAAHESYASVFRQLERQVEKLHGELDGLSGQLKSLEAQIGTTEAELQQIDAEMTRLDAQGAVAGYNALVPRQNALADRHNTLVDRYNRLVGSYNRKVDEVNALALEQDQLATSLGSKPSVPAAGAP